MKLRLVLPLALLSLFAFEGTALAATKNGITPLSPKAGATVPVGKSPTFRVRVKGPGHVWIHICKKKKKRADGTICSNPDLGEAHRKSGRVFSWKPKFFDYPAFYLNTPGTYYWQAFRIFCAGRDCAQEGPVVKFKVG